MNIIIGQKAASEVDDRYILLELDSFKIAQGQEPVKTYCLIEKINLGEVFALESRRELHQNLIKNYRLKNWKFCLDALEHLKGSWDRELDSFYEILESRIIEFQNTDPGPNWDGIINQFET